MPELVLTAADDGRALDVGPGTGITVVLAENPTTGYGWQVTDSLPGCLASKSSRYDRDAGGAIGQGGQRSFGFVVVAAGACDLALELRRPWETGVEPVGRFRVHLTVR